MRVAIDATSLLDRPTGVGVFTRELVDGLAAVRDAEGLDLSVFAVSWRGRDGLAGAVPPGVAVRARPVPARLARPLWARSDHPSAAWLGGRADVVHGPNHVVPPGGGAAEGVTVHDLTAVHFPELCTPDVRAWPALLDRAVQRGAWIHTPTRFVADEARQRWPAAAARVVAIPHGLRRPPEVDAATAAAQAAAGARLAGAERYVLALGTVEPRKDLVGLVAAFDAVAAELDDVVLVIAGPDGWGTDEFVAAWEASPFRRRIRRIGWIDAAARTALTRGASVVAYPSRYEGFGFVPLEALAVGTPVVATAVGAVEEVTGDAAVLVPPGDRDALADALRAVLVDPGSVAVTDRLARGRVRLDALTWDRATAGFVDLYRRASG